MHLKNIGRCVPVVARLAHPSAELTGPPLGFKGTQQGAPALVPHQVRQVLVCFAAVLVGQAGQLEERHHLMPLLH